MPSLQRLDLSHSCVGNVTSPMDGRSFAPALLDRAVAPPTRSTTMLVDFDSLSYGNPDTPTYAPDQEATGNPPGTGSGGLPVAWNTPAAAAKTATTATAATVIDDPEGSVAMAGSCYNLHSSHSEWSTSTFIALRIINATHDLAYSDPRSTHGFLTCTYSGEH